MPMSRKYGDFACDHPGCTESFTISYRLERHQLTHLKYEEREFACPFEGCKTRSNEKTQLALHIKRIHKRKWACDHPGCSQKFTRKRDRTKHEKRVHGIAARSNFPTASSFRRPTEHPGVQNATDVQHDCSIHTKHREGAQTVASQISPLLSSSTLRQDLTFNHPPPEQFIDPDTVPFRFRRKGYITDAQSSQQQRG